MMFVIPAKAGIHLLGYLDVTKVIFRLYIGK
jgi:hypothetical protein